MVFTFYLLVIGHLLVDFILQRELATKKRGINYEMQLHAATGALFFMVPLVALSYPVASVAKASIIIFLLHMLIDVLKLEADKKLKIRPNTNMFWAAIGIDQIVHITSIYLIFSNLVLV